MRRAITVLLYSSFAGGSLLAGALASELYSLQLATFASKEAAFSYLRTLPEPLREKAQVVLSGSVYAVRLYSTSYQEARKEKELLKKRYSINSFIVKAEATDRPVSPEASVKKRAKSSLLYSIQLGAFREKKRAELFIKSLPSQIRDEAFIYLSNSGYYTVRLWPSEEIAPLRKRLSYLKKRFGLKGFIVKTLPKKLPSVKAPQPQSLDVKFSVEGKGASSPAVENRTPHYPGTAENRRAEITAVALKSSQVEGRVELKKDLKKGIYTFELSLSHLYPAEKVKDALFLVELPPQSYYVVGSARVNGKRVEVKRKGSLLALHLGELPGNAPLKLSLKFLSDRAVELRELPYAITFKLPNGKEVVLGKRELLKGAPKTLKKKEVKLNYGFIYPDRDKLIVADDRIDLKFVLPLKTPYRLTVNGQPVPQKLMAEKSVDKARKAVFYSYIGVPLKKGENAITLEFNGRKLEKKVIVSDEVYHLNFSIYPKRPVADGRSSAYVVIEAYDKNGNPAKVNSYIEVWVDKGDIYDYKAGTYKKFVNDGFKVRLVDGRAVVRLSPADEPEERTLKVVFGDIEREVRVRFYPEKRPWLVVGELEGALGHSNTSGNPPKITDMPYDHSDDGFHFKGRGALFAKGSIKDYTITVRYDTKPPDDVLMKQRIPSTEEGQFYPVYGDDSEQYFEAKSKRHLYLRVDKGLSYFLFGDYNTDFGREFDFGRYSRTFNGALVNLEEKENYRLKGFVSENSQDVVREEFQGKGISGPYFLSSSPIEFSEKVWIEVRDRYNPDIILKRKRLNRFTDYEINYEEGFIILHEPLPQFDENFNPEYLVVIYETDSLPEKEYMYGLRAEKWIKGIRFGAFGVKEEHPQKDKKLYGVDAYYYRAGLKVVAEAVGSEGFEGDNFETTEGSAFRIEATYSQKAGQYRLFYKKVNDGFQNPSSTTAQEAYTNYGFSASKDFKSFKVSAGGFVDDRKGIERKEAELLLTKRFSEKFSIDLGLRHNREEREGAGTESYSQGIFGAQLRPTEKLTLSLKREQAFGGEKASSYYPTRTVGRADYKWTSKTSTYLQTEIRELPKGNESLTTFGINSQVAENTTAYSKYTVRDGSSGWRTQSHIGLNHVFKIRDDLAFDVGLENVHTFTGDDEKRDYTALRLRGLYTQSERYKLSGEYQVRFGEVDTEHLVRVGGVFKPTENLTLLIRDRFFLSDYRENDLLLGLARRPVENDRFNYLLKLRWKISSRDDTTNKYILSFHGNYQPVKRLTLMGEYAVKYVDVKNVGTSLTDLLRGRLLYDITDRIDIGFHAGVIRQRTSNTYTFSYGPEIGFNLFENFWISFGYNFNGFYDDDFDDANYWAEGPYLKFRLKFDENTFKKLKLLKEKGENRG